MAKTVQTRVSGTWRNVKAVSVKVSGTWRNCKQVYVKVSGVWKELLATLVFNLSTAAKNQNIFFGYEDNFGLHVSEDGTKLIVLSEYEDEDGYKRLDYYNLTTPYDLTSRSTISSLVEPTDSLWMWDEVFSRPIRASPMEFNGDGSTLYVLSGATQITTAPCTVNFDPTTSSSGTLINVPSINYFIFMESGTRLAWSTNSGSIEVFSLSTAYDIGSRTLISSFNFASAGRPEPLSFRFSSSGTKLFYASNDSGVRGIYQCQLAGKYNLTTVTQEFYLAVTAEVLRGGVLQFVNDEFLYGADSSGNVYRFD